MYTYGLITELSRNEKLQKYRIILFQHTNYLHKWLVQFLTCLLLPFLQNFCMCKPRTTFYLLWQAGLPGLAFYESWLACLLSCLWMVNRGLLGSIWSEIFLQIKFIIFQGCPTKKAAFLPWQPAPYNHPLNQPILLVPEYYFS